MKFIIENWTYLIDLLLVIVGLSAIVVYCAQKRAELLSAGTLIIGQIDLVEKNVSVLKNDHQLNNVAVYNSKPIIKENMWEKYKHLFAKRLDGSEYEIVQQFFDHAEQLERARLDIVFTMTNGWKDKSSIEHQVVAQMIRDKLSVEEVEWFRGAYRPLDLVFTADVIINSLTKNKTTAITSIIIDVTA